jgi:hypothetical protein
MIKNSNYSLPSQIWQLKKPKTADETCVKTGGWCNDGAMQFAKATLTSKYLVRREADSSAQLLKFSGHPPVSYLLHSYTLLHVTESISLS